MIAQFKQMLAETGGPMASSQGYMGAYHMAHEEDIANGNDGTTSLIDSVTKYVERASATKDKVEDLCAGMAQLQ